MIIDSSCAGKVGLPPGQVVFVGEEKPDAPQIHIIKFNEDEAVEANVPTVAEALQFIDDSSVTWINVSGLHRVDWIEEFGKAFNIHTLLLEDIAHTSQRPKLEEFDNYIFFVLKKLFLEDGEVIDEQVSVILGENYVLTFIEERDNLFKSLYERIKNKSLRVNTQKSDYLTYCILDTIVDNYFLIIEELGERIEFLEDEVLIKPSPNILEDIHSLKNNLLSLKRSIWPLREVMNKFERSDSRLINKQTKPFIHDVYEHTIYILDAVGNYRDILSGVLDIYLSSLSNRMNEVMKTLTIIATIFIPLTFIAGIYGMNFKYMPELNWHWGYFSVWAFMIITAMIMVLYFRKKKWL